jgi:hypothetical protein
MAVEAEQAEHEPAEETTALAATASPPAASPPAEAADAKPAAAAAGVKPAAATAVVPRSKPAVAAPAKAVGKKLVVPKPAAGGGFKPPGAPNAGAGGSKVVQQSRQPLAPAPQPTGGSMRPGIKQGPIHIPQGASWLEERSGLFG